MKWYRNGETHRFSQPVGKQYKYGKSGSSHLDEMTQKDLKIRQLEMQIEVLKKYLERTTKEKGGGKINYNGGCREFSGEISNFN
ncbi:hypothetical protein EEL30_22575 [Brevibacillus laterosporus]|uniref:Transposase n=1 Tax=Brevibacillus laterosporus TaxID=1465 RepID=A0A518VCV1_BRELA|nr:hypothetical protein EEL30_22575 [Brevibacillus laterosporus]